MYRVFARAVDDAGNVGDVSNVTLWLDVTAPAGPPTLKTAPPSLTLSTDAVFEMQAGDDGSPGQSSFWYMLLTDGVPVTSAWTAVPTKPVTASAPVQLSLSGLRADASHLLRVVTRDQLSRSSARETVHSWRVVSAAPSVTMLSMPANVSALSSPSFDFSVALSGGGGGGGGGGVDSDSLRLVYADGWSAL
jgi:hypothetical protein